MPKPDYDPKDHSAITRVTKRGDWYTVEGVSGGRKTSVDIPAPSVESRDRKSAEALMRRSLYGTARAEREGRQG